MELPDEFFHATLARYCLNIAAHGLLPSDLSTPGQTPHVYLARTQDVAHGYVESGRGMEGDDEAMVILRVDGRCLDAALLRPESGGQEVDLLLDDLKARGYTAAQIRAGDYPWHVCLEETGQCMYAGTIAPAALRVVFERCPASPGQTCDTALGAYVEALKICSPETFDYLSGPENAEVSDGFLNV